jgi:hypothetical protein
MLRTEIPEVRDDQVEMLRLCLYAAVQYAIKNHEDIFMYPEKEDIPAPFFETLTDKNFDPRPQIVYLISSFDTPDKPIDTYQVYFLLECKRFVVLMERNGVTGEFGFGDFHLDGQSLSPPISEEENEARFKALEIKHGCFIKKTDEVAPQSYTKLPGNPGGLT